MTVKISRRQFVQASAAALPLSMMAAKAAEAKKSLIGGVEIGVQTYSYHDILNDSQNHADQVIQKMQACGLYSCELFSPQIEHSNFTGRLPADCPKPFLGCPAGKGGSARNPWAWEFARAQGKDQEAARAKEKQWRETVSLDYFTAIRKKFNDAGMTIYSYNPMWNMEWSDKEIDRTFQFAKALGAKAVNTSTQFAVFKRLVPFAEKNQIIVAAHGHGVTWDPEEFSSEATFERVFALSKWVGANLDIGHYSATGANPVEFIKKHHARIANLHLKDRKKNHSNTEEDGATVPWGQGETPIKEVLQLLKKEKYPIPAFIEYEYTGTADPVGEVKKSVELCKQYLA